MWKVIVFGVQVLSLAFSAIGMKHKLQTDKYGIVFIIVVYKMSNTNYVNDIIRPNNKRCVFPISLVIINLPCLFKATK